MSVRNILAWLEDAARLSPDAPAFAQPEGNLTWSQVKSRAQCIGSRLTQLIAGQSPVLILMEKSPECLCAMLGAVYAGCFYTPLDSTMPEARMALIAGTLRPAAVLYEERFVALASRIANGVPALCASDIQAAPDKALLRARRQAHIDGDLLYVLFTSGSTGTPDRKSVGRERV